MPGADKVQLDDDLVNPHQRECWKDLIGDVTPKTQGAGSPTLATFRDNLRGFRYSAGDDGDIIYHIPHDMKPGSDMFLHIHWGHNGTNISGSFEITCHLSYAKGHQQANFTAEKNISLVVPNLNITNTPQYHHRVDEVPMSIAGGSATLLDSSQIEVDGIILMKYDVVTIPTITGGAGEPFIFTFDVHYLRDRVGTRRRFPDFYTE